MSEAALRAAVPEPHIDDALLPTYKQLLGIQRRLTEMKGKTSHAMEDLRYYQNQLDAIDSKRSADGIFCGDLKSNVPAGQAAAADVLSACYSLISELVDTASPISAELSDTYRSLAGIRNALLQLRTARTWDDAEVDRKLKRYQGQLDKIDGERSARGGIFGGGKASLHHVPAGQAACAEELAECFDLVAEIQARRNGAAGGGA